MLRALIAQYNGEKHRSNGKAVLRDRGQGELRRGRAAIAKGTLKPAIWSPSSSLWGRLLNYEADQPIMARTNDSIVRTPLVIAMWEPMARALGWPKKQLGFADILQLATRSAGWATYGQPKYGAVPARPHEPGLLDLRPVGRRRRVLRARPASARA